MTFWFRNQGRDYGAARLKLVSGEAIIINKEETGSSRGKERPLNAWKRERTHLYSGLLFYLAKIVSAYLMVYARDLNHFRSFLHKVKEIVLSTYYNRHASVKEEGKLDLTKDKGLAYVYEWIRMRRRKMEEEEKKRKKIMKQMKKLTKHKKK